jgi:hypothetical protein
MYALACGSKSLVDSPVSSGTLALVLDTTQLNGLETPSHVVPDPK